ncbi:MAG: hypothetical protein ACTS4Z_02250 [Candidatus Hodgkinia cicadicola]
MKEFGKFKRKQKGRLFISEGVNPINIAMRNLMTEDCIDDPFTEEANRLRPSWLKERMCEIFPSQFNGSLLEFRDLEKINKTASTFEIVLVLERVKFKQHKGWRQIERRTTLRTHLVTLPTSFRAEEEEGKVLKTGITQIKQYCNVNFDCKTNSITFEGHHDKNSVKLRHERGECIVSVGDRDYSWKEISEVLNIRRGGNDNWNRRDLQHKPKGEMKIGFRHSLRVHANLMLRRNTCEQMSFRWDRTNGFTYANSKLINRTESETKLKETISSIVLDYGSRLMINAWCGKFHYPPEGSRVTKNDITNLRRTLLEKEGVQKDDNSEVRPVRSFANVIAEIIVRHVEHEVNANLSYIMQTNGKSKKKLFVALQARVDSLISSSALNQFTDQTNTLAEESHRLKLSYKAEGGSRSVKTAVRDVKRWYMGGICPISSSEGGVIGLVNELAMFAKITADGRILTPYLKVREGKVSDETIYLSFIEAQSFTVVPYMHSHEGRVIAMRRGKPHICEVTEIDLCLPTNANLFSGPVNLIPFLNHNNPIRLLTAANMQKQAVPLLEPRPPLVGTGFEEIIMARSGHNIVSDEFCLVVWADAKVVVVYQFALNKFKKYLLPEVEMSNQNTCKRVRCVVRPEQILNPGDAIAECQSSSDGELSLGSNLTVAFMCWKGLNFEDSIAVSEDVAAEKFQSVHIYELCTAFVQSYEGYEVLTNDPDGVAAKQKVHLERTGIIRIGAYVQKGDILVGKKFIPTGGNLDRKVNISLRVPNTIDFATVISVVTAETSEELVDHIEHVSRVVAVHMKSVRRIWKLFVINSCKEGSFIGLSDWLNLELKSGGEQVNVVFDALRHQIEEVLNTKRAVETAVKRPKRERTKVKEIKVKLSVLRTLQVGDKLCGRHGNKGVVSCVVPREDMPYTPSGKPIDVILNPLSVSSRMNYGQVLETQFGLISIRLGEEFRALLRIYEQTNDIATLVKLAIPKLKEVLPDVSLTPRDEQEILNLVKTYSEGVRLSVPPFTKVHRRRIDAFFNRARLANGFRQIQLYDGFTGKPFDHKTTVGVIYMFKLNHMVDDKMYARSTGPYSDVTKQPVKGKKYRGGQRLGEMEMWALQSHRAPHLIREVISTKCDDIAARESYKRSLVSNETQKYSGSESFRVLQTELTAIGLNVGLT